jgi:hypothetical protein
VQPLVDGDVAVRLRHGAARGDARAEVGGELRLRGKIVGEPYRSCRRDAVEADFMRRRSGGCGSERDAGIDEITERCGEQIFRLRRIDDEARTRRNEFHAERCGRPQVRR